MSDEYSEVADRQLTEIENGPDLALHDAVVDALTVIFDFPGKARGLSAAVRTADGVVLRLPVVDCPPWKVFWTSDGPRILAVMPFPT